MIIIKNRCKHVNLPPPCKLHPYPSNLDRRRIPVICKAALARAAAKLASAHGPKRKHCARYVDMYNDPNWKPHMMAYADVARPPGQRSPMPPEAKGHSPPADEC